ncbi:hypothetical protein SLEP1_g14402 [Rubroshorea leprosula]|uniref:Uncharacterized protein n=1 Tax=Rubroshorea leprosula TaxID=152421 RepID=A0AAV5IPV2_9ROSI|nr:hypothetical protein SLEP1_g14402 [Rubroshorea leprosula]
MMGGQTLVPVDQKVEVSTQMDKENQKREELPPGMQRDTDIQVNQIMTMMMILT